MVIVVLGGAHSMISCTKIAGVKGLLAIVVGLGLTGCGATLPPRAELTAAEVAISGAREADATEYAAGPFALAQDKLARAQDALAREDHTTARRLAEQAEVDAQFAEAVARSEVTHARAAELRESIRILHEEIERQQSPSS